MTSEEQQPDGEEEEEETLETCRRGNLHRKDGSLTQKYDRKKTNNTNLPGYFAGSPQNVEGQELLEPRYDLLYRKDQDPRPVVTPSHGPGASVCQCLPFPCPDHVVPLEGGAV